MDEDALPSGAATVSPARPRRGRLTADEQVEPHSSPGAREAAGIYIDEELDRAPRRHPAARYPSLLQRLIPEPMRSDRELERFRLADLAGMSPSQARLEALKIRTAIAVVVEPDDADDIAAWLLRRLAALDARGRSGEAHER